MCCHSALNPVRIVLQQCFVSWYEVTEDAFIQNNYSFFFCIVWEHILSTVICLTSRCDIMAVGRYHYKLWLWNALREFSTRRRPFEKLPRSLPPPSPPSPPWSLIYPQGSPSADVDVVTLPHLVMRLMNAWNQPGSPSPCSSGLDAFFLM